MVVDRVLYLGASAGEEEEMTRAVVRFWMNARDDDEVEVASGDETSGDMLKTPVRSASVVSGDGERCWLNLIDVDGRCGTGWYCIILVQPGRLYGLVLATSARERRPGVVVHGQEGSGGGR